MVSSKPSGRRPFSFSNVKKGVSLQSVNWPEHFQNAPAYFLFVGGSLNGYVLIPLGIVAAAGAGVGGVLLVKHRKENADEEETAE